MIDIMPTLAENVSDLAVNYSGAIITSWAEVYKLEIVFLALGAWLGFGIGYHCYRLGIRFPWHKGE